MRTRKNPTLNPKQQRRIIYLLFNKPAITIVGDKYLETLGWVRVYGHETYLTERALRYLETETHLHTWEKWKEEDI